MKLEWKKRNFDGHEVIRLILTDAYNESRTIASIVTLQPNKNEEKMFDLRYTLYFGELTYIINFIDESKENK